MCHSSGLRADSGPTIVMLLCLLLLCCELLWSGPLKQAVSSSGPLTSVGYLEWFDALFVFMAGDGVCVSLLMS